MEPRLLHIDFNPSSSITLIERIIRNCGWDVVVAYNKKTALGLTVKEEPNLVLIDLCPEANDCIPELRNMYIGPIIATGNSEADQELKSYYNLYLTKPIDSHEFIKLFIDTRILINKSGSDKQTLLAWISGYQKTAPGNTTSLDIEAT